MNNSMIEKNWLDALREFSSPEEIRMWLSKRNTHLAPQNLKKLAIVGAADEGVRLYQLCVEREIEVVAIVDDNPEEQGLRIGKSSVCSIDALHELDRGTPIIIASHRILNIMERLKAMGFDLISPFALLETLAPKTFTPHMFYDGLLEDLVKHRGRYLELRDLLTDEKSRQVLNAVVGFRLTFEPEVLKPVIDWNLYVPANLFSYRDDEVYVDG